MECGFRQKVINIKVSGFIIDNMATVFSNTKQALIKVSLKIS